jgi:hypothetical protein
MSNEFRRALATINSITAWRTRCAISDRHRSRHRSVWDEHRNGIHQPGMARGCALFDLQDNPTSPIIMSHRVCDRSKELAVIMQVFVQTYTA